MAFDRAGFTAWLSAQPLDPKGPDNYSATLESIEDLCKISLDDVVPDRTVALDALLSLHLGLIGKRPRNDSARIRKNNLLKWLISLRAYHRFRQGKPYTEPAHDGGRLVNLVESVPVA